MVTSAGAATDLHVTDTSLRPSDSGSDTVIVLTYGTRFT